MKKRYADVVKKNKIDFVFRPHGKVASLLIANVIYVVAMVVLTQICPVNIIYPIVNTCLYMLFVVFKIRQSANTLHHIEFQNALFANSLKKDTQFFLIMSQNGDVIYNDERSGIQCDTFKGFLGKVNLDDKKKELLLESMRTRSHCQVQLISAEFLIESPILQLELFPLHRPDGYFILKAVRQTKEVMYAEIMEQHVVGSYILNSKGLLLSANKSFLDIVEGGNVDTESIYLPELINPKPDMQLRTLLHNSINVYVSAQLLHDAAEKYTYGLVTLKNFERSEFLEAPIAIAQFDKRGKILKHNYAFSYLITEKCNSIADITRDDIDFDLYFVQTTENSITSNLTLKNGKVVKIFLKKSVANTITVFFFDITQYKQIEEQLLHSQKVHSIGELAGGIAHDFNNILAAIVGFCDLILVRHTLQDQTFVDMMQIKQNAERATHLVSKLLAFSRRQTLTLEVLEISETLEGVSSLIRRLIGANVNLKVHYTHNVGRVKADKRQLEQVVMNLAINARDAMQDTGNFTIMVSEEVIGNDIDGMISANLDDNIIPGEYIVLKFIDGGCGIPQDILNKIFDPFFSTKAEEEGTGLGLSTVYGIIRQIGGYIYIKSVVGEGTQINIYLHKVYEKISKVSNEVNTFHKVPDYDLTTSQNISLIEDEEAVRTFMRRALDREGYNIFDYSSSVEALRDFADKKIDIVITDIIMPEMSGVDMIKKIRETTPNIQIIFISGYSKKKLDGVEYQYSFLQKPFSLEQLISKVQEVSTFNAQHDLK